MRRSLNRKIILLFAILIGISAKGQTGMKALLPAEGELTGWELQGEPKEYSGEDLFILIDGGADLVSEYGFKEVITATVVSDEGDELQLEIYRMADSFAAFGVYLQKKPGNAAGYEAGNNCFIDEFSLGFWKQHYFALIRTKYTSDSITAGMKIIADLVDSRIRNRGRWPEIFTQAASGATGKITLIRGKIALSNVYHFTSRDIFRIDEGIAIENSTGTEILFRYETPDESVHRLGEVAGFLSRDERFTGFRMTGDLSFALVDDEGNDIEITSDGKYLRVDIVKSGIY